MLIIFILLQAILLCAGQVMMKIALTHMPAFSWSKEFFVGQMTNFWWLGTGISFTAAGLLWMYILKHFLFSQAYPLTGITYAFGLMAAALVFHESVAWTQWVGVLLIMAGCYLIIH